MQITLLSVRVLLRNIITNVVVIKLKQKEQSSVISLYCCYTGMWSKKFPLICKISP